MVSSARCQFGEALRCCYLCRLYYLSDSVNSSIDLFLAFPLVPGHQLCWGWSPHRRMGPPVRFDLWSCTRHCQNYHPQSTYSIHASSRPSLLNYFPSRWAFKFDWKSSGRCLCALDANRFVDVVVGVRCFGFESLWALLIGRGRGFGCGVRERFGNQNSLHWICFVFELSRNFLGSFTYQTDQHRLDSTMQTYQLVTSPLSAA